MGAYFSLREATEWEEMIRGTMEPSIWTNVNFTPLGRSQKMLLHRRGSVEFSFPSGMCQGEDMIQVSDVSDLSLLLGFEESAGRLYSALLIHATFKDQPHRYCRGLTEFTLKAGTSQPSSAHKGADEIFSGEMSFAQVGKERETAPTDTVWPYLMLYAVKEGVLAFFARDIESCEYTVREIAASYGEEERGTGTGPGPSTASARIKTVHHAIGRMPPPVCRVLTGLVDSDLKRRFAVHAEPEDQAECTNCMCFCLRIMLGMQLAIRGYDIRRVCEERADLGPIAGEAASAAWELLWRRVRV